MTRPKQMTYMEMLRAKELLQEMHANHAYNLEPEAAAAHARGCNYCDAPPVIAQIAERMETEASQHAA